MSKIKLENKFKIPRLFLKVKIFSVHSHTQCPGKNPIVILSRRRCPVEIRWSLNGQCFCQRPLTFAQHIKIGSNPVTHILGGLCKHSICE